MCILFMAYQSKFQSQEVDELFEAIMKQAREDAEQDKDKTLKTEAQRYIDKMQKAFS